MLYVLISPALAGVISAGVGAVAGIGGTYMQNRMARDEAQRERNFQREMRNTQYQAAVADMEAAGLNPALAYQQGGAGGATGAVAPIENPLRDGVSNALAVRQQNAQIDLMKEQGKEVSARRALALNQAKKAGHEASIAARENDARTARWSYYFDEHGNAKEPLMELLRAEHQSSMATNARSVSELEALQLSIPERKALAAVFERVGGGGKGAQLMLPLLMQIIRSRN